MMRRMVYAKIHRASVTDKNIDYEGSITIDMDIVDAAGMVPGECVLVVNLSNGARFDTYIIPGVRGSGEVCVNGGAARLVERGDKLIIIAYGFFAEEELENFSMKVVYVDEQNRILPPRS